MYDDLALLADSLLKEFGQPVTIRHTVPGEYDPEIGGASSVTTNSVGVGAVFDYGSKLVDGTLILIGDKQLLLSPVGVGVPVPGDLVIIDAGINAGTWSIVPPVKTTAPAGVEVGQSPIRQVV